MARRKWWIAASVVVAVALVAVVATALYIALPTKAASSKNAVYTATLVGEVSGRLGV